MHEASQRSSRWRFHGQTEGPSHEAEKGSLERGALTMPATVRGATLAEAVPR